MSGRRKAAIFLTTLGDEASAAILRQLPEEQVHDITREISVLGKLTSHERKSVLHEFVEAVENPHTLNPGGIEYATSVLLAAFGPETGKRMAERLLRSVGNDSSNIDSLRKADAQQLAKIVQREHPQTLALILCNLDTAKAARLLSELPEKLRAQVVRRVAALDQVSPDVTNRLATIIGSKLRIQGESSLESFGGVRTVAELLNRVDPATSEEILKEIADNDATLGQEIRQHMFVFEDLVNLSQDSLRKLLAAVDRPVLTLGLKGSSPQIKKHITSVMSTRAADMLVEDMQALGPVRIRDVQQAQQNIIEKARQLHEAGEISLQAGSSEEFVE